MDRPPTDASDDEGPVIHIELSLDGSIPTGMATGPDGATRRFTGWVGLMSAVDALAAGDDNTLTEEDSP